MRRYVQRFFEWFRKGDLVLLLLCVVATSFGCLMIASTTNASSTGALRYLVIQIGAAAAGILAYVGISAVNTEFFSEHRTSLVLFNTALLLLLIPFGETISGNRSWLNFPLLPFNIQPAEICKITFVLMAKYRSSVNSASNCTPSRRPLATMAPCCLTMVANWAGITPGRNTTASPHSAPTLVPPT